MLDSASNVSTHFIQLVNPGLRESKVEFMDAMTNLTMLRGISSHGPFAGWVLECIDSLRPFGVSAERVLEGPVAISTPVGTVH